MQDLQETLIYCPYCGEPISLLVDEQEVGDEYTEDCQVCCQPMVVAVVANEQDQLEIRVRSENQTF
ncbi:CPXCG motif-containing cysteine-rich protein [Gayadomonas joobiniege]|uniref:CPXCG motif-containing cysteine-rich protein n=1 Tax=Gayadomonas joobiniege TaxID=1234606 RepID=UPI00037488B0|nr:CPXCG motif-containing cysteine-rich protein [Gayadomonas joobiniege]